MSGQELNVGPCRLFHGNSLDVLPTLPDCSVDSVVCDPPYGLSDHRPEEVVACLKAWLAGEPYAPKGRGFMGKSWDAWVPGPEVWRECLRVLKPGGHVMAFAGTRSMDLMSMAIRLAGFELRDSIGFAHDGGGAPLLAWTHGQGFPKSHDVSKAIDKTLGGNREIVGRDVVHDLRNSAGGDSLMAADRGSRPDIEILRTSPATAEAAQWEGWGTALKPAWEPIILARKPLEGTVAENVLSYGTGALNIDACRVGWPDGKVPRVGTPEWGGPNKKSTAVPGQDGATVERAGPSDLGRFPANIIHDGSDEVLAAFPDAAGQQGDLKSTGRARPSSGRFGDMAPPVPHAARGDSGSAARFFYSAKASRADRNDGLINPGPQFKRNATLRQVENTETKGNIHPTVKNTPLMRYLCRLGTPPGGVVLDPFMGSGSTGRGAVLEGFSFIGIEMDKAYFDIAAARIGAAVDRHIAEKNAPEIAQQSDLFAA